MQDVTNLNEKILTKVVIFDEQVNGVYNVCLIENNFNRLCDYLATRFKYTHQQIECLRQSFIKDKTHIN